MANGLNVIPDALRGSAVTFDNAGTAIQQVIGGLVNGVQGAASGARDPVVTGALMAFAAGTQGNLQTLAAEIHGMAGAARSSADAYVATDQSMAH